MKINFLFKGPSVRCHVSGSEGIHTSFFGVTCRHEIGLSGWKRQPSSCASLGRGLAEIGAIHSNGSDWETSKTGGFCLVSLGVAFWFHFGFLLVSIWLLMVSLWLHLVAFWLPFGFLLVSIWLLLVSLCFIWLPFGCLLVSRWLLFSFTLVAFGCIWLPFGCLLVFFCFQFDCLSGVTLVSFGCLWVAFWLPFGFMLVAF